MRSVYTIWKTKTKLKSLLQAGFRYAFALCHSTDDAEDLVQEAWLKLYNRRYKITQALLFTTVRNLYIDQYRHNQLVILEEFNGDADPFDDEIKVEISDSALTRYLEALRPIEREALFLSVVVGYTAKETAQIMNSNRSTVLSLIKRSKHKLRKLISENDEKMDNYGVK